jgi:hypothetical protein
MTTQLVQAQSVKMELIRIAKIGEVPVLVMGAWHSGYNRYS